MTAGPDGAIWFTSRNSTIGRMTLDGRFDSFQLPAAAQDPKNIVTGADGNLWILAESTTPTSNGSRLPVMVRLVPPASTTTSLVAATLPTSRSVQVTKTATAFATIINTTAASASGCQIQPLTTLPSSFLYQTTDKQTNALSGTANTPATIAAGDSQSFVVALTPSAPFAPTDVRFGFTCTNLPAAPVVSGLDTLLLSASASPVPDIIALVASVEPGIVSLAGASGQNAFAVATSNIGSADTITVSANTGAATLPVSLLVCASDPATAICNGPKQPSVSLTIASNATPTFNVYTTGSGTVPFDPANNRVFVVFKDSGGIIRGETSVAVRTQ